MYNKIFLSLRCINGRVRYKNDLSFNSQEIHLSNIYHLLSLSGKTFSDNNRDKALSVYCVLKFEILGKTKLSMWTIRKSSRKISRFYCSSAFQTDRRSIEIETIFIACNLNKQCNLFAGEHHFPLRSLFASQWYMICARLQNKMNRLFFFSKKLQRKCIRTDATDEKFDCLTQSSLCNLAIELRSEMEKYESYIVIIRKIFLWTNASWKCSNSEYILSLDLIFEEAGDKEAGDRRCIQPKFKV